MDQHNFSLGYLYFTQVSAGPEGCDLTATVKQALHLPVSNQSHLKTIVLKIYRIFILEFGLPCKMLSCPALKFSPPG